MADSNPCVCCPIADECFRDCDERLAFIQQYFTPLSTEELNQIENSFFAEVVESCKMQ